MCGIAALFTFFPQDLSAICEMASLVKHRGPDDEGSVFFKTFTDPPLILGGRDTPANVYQATWNYCPKTPTLCLPKYPCRAALAHRRLSIVDLSEAGHQPMCSTDQKIWITYNGEVYNFIEIKQELQCLGYSFQTQCDTEVILKAYQHWGKACLDHFNGMFALVIYDQKRQTVFAARDRFGVKPLYYWISPTGLIAFASEIKQFSILQGWKPKMNGQNVYDFLNWGVSDHNSQTLYAEVHQIRGGEFIEFSLENAQDINIKPIQWYFPKIVPFEGNFQEAAKRFVDILENSICLRLRSDVPIGSCLSGGLDSSSIVCLANQLLRRQNAAQQQKTFSACSHVQRFDERHFIDLVVSQSNVEAHYTYPTLEGLFEECDQLLWHQDEPFCSTSIYAQWQVFKMAKSQNVKVMLDGQGADEQLAGYLGFFGNRFYDLFASLRWKTLFDEMRQTKGLHGGIQPVPLLINKLVPDFIRQPMRKLLGKSAANPSWINLEQLKAQPRDPFSKENNKTLLHQSLLQIKQSSLPMLLHYEDRDSMAHSIESRTPFIDYRLVEFALGLPSDFKLAQGWTKRPLREGLKDILPEPIRMRRDKMGFVTAEEEWIKKQNPKLFQNAVKDALEASQGILLPSVCQIADQTVSGKRPFSYLVWRLISFGRWVKLFSINQP